MTDQPGNGSDFEACVVPITGVLVEPASEDGAGEEATDGEVDEDAEESSGVDDVEADLVEMQGGNTQPVEEHELHVGEYGRLKLAVSNVGATLEDGGDADVTTPGDPRPKVDESFEIREGQRTVHRRRHASPTGAVRRVRPPAGRRRHAGRLRGRRRVGCPLSSRVRGRSRTGVSRGRVFDRFRSPTGPT